LINQKTYWFTIATGQKYREMVKPLIMSLKKHHIELNVIGSDSMNRIETKYQKITGILESPVDCDRIVYLDADTLVLNPVGIENMNGSWQVPWKIPAEACIPKNLDKNKYINKLEEFYRQNNLSVFRNDGEFEGIEWNSGVIAGERQILVELAKEWAFWWDRILELFDGHFRRDQVSYRIAYYKVFKLRNEIPDLPIEYNWVVSYFGINPNANILHRTMLKNVDWIEKDWNSIVDKAIAGTKAKTKNSLFDLSGIQNAMPCLNECIHLNRDLAYELLIKALKLKNAKKILIIGDLNENIKSLIAKNQISVQIHCANSIETIDNQIDYNFLIFNSLEHLKIFEYLITKNAVACFFNAHKLEFYQFLFRFMYVRFVDYNFVLFSNSSEIVEWNFHEK
jgi:hypothetical protein